MIFVPFCCFADRKAIERKARKRKREKENLKHRRKRRRKKRRKKSKWENISRQLLPITSGNKIERERGEERDP